MSNLHNKMYNGTDTKYHKKYLLYKKKYLNLLRLIGGNPNPDEWDHEEYEPPPLPKGPPKTPPKAPTKAPPKAPTPIKEKFKTISKQDLNYYSKDGLLSDAIIKNNFDLVRKIIEDDWTDKERVEWRQQIQIQESNEVGSELKEEYSTESRSIKKIRKFPLTIAFESIIGKDSRIIKLLVEKGIYNESEHPLYYSCKIGLLDIVQILISQGMINDFIELPDYEARVIEIKTSLDIALENDNNDIAKLLINSGTDIRSKDSFEIALNKKFTDVLVLILIKELKHIILYEPDVIRIIQLNNFSLIKILIESGNKYLLKNINILFDNINYRLLSPLKRYIEDSSLHFNTWALPGSKKLPEDVLKFTSGMLGNDAYTQILALIRARINQLLFIIAVIDNSVVKTKTIIDEGCDINQQFNGESALDFSLKNNNIEIIKLLIESEINLTIPQFIIIARLNNFSLIKILIEKGSQILLDNIDEILKNDDIKEKLREYVRDPYSHNNQDLFPDRIRSKLGIRGSRITNEFISSDVTKEIIKLLLEKLPRLKSKFGLGSAITNDTEETKLCLLEELVRLK